MHKGIERSELGNEDIGINIEKRLHRIEVGHLPLSCFFNIKLGKFAFFVSVITRPTHWARGIAFIRRKDFLDNMSPHQVLGMISPEEYVLGRKPNVLHFRIFGASILLIFHRDILLFSWIIVFLY